MYNSCEICLVTCINSTVVLEMQCIQAYYTTTQYCIVCSVVYIHYQCRYYLVV